MRTPNGRGLWTSPRWRMPGAVAAGAVPALAFPAPALWWIAYVALVPWLLLLRSAGSGRRAALEGWLGGIGLTLAVHHWLLPSLHVFLFLLAALLGLLWAPWGWLARRTLSGRPSAVGVLSALLVLPAGWMLPELVRSFEGLGGPWGMLGASQWQVPLALRLASVGGVWLVSMLVVAVNTAVVLALTAPRSARYVALFGLLVLALLTGGLAGLSPQPVVDGQLRLAIVQPGVVSGPNGVERRFDLGERLTRQLVGQSVDLVVWGESSVGADLEARPDLARRLAALSAETGAPLLVNVDARPPGGPGIYKSSVLVGPDGPTGERYDKMRLVPFGEYVPARSLLGWASWVGKAAGEDRIRGSGPVLMRLPGASNRGSPLLLGPLICFESAFPDMTRRLVRDGAGLIVVQSSTSTFQHSWAPAQHAALAALRAAESGRTTVHATLTGVSTVHGPRGEPIGGRLGTGSSSAAVYEVPLAQGVTPYVRYGDWAVYAALLVLAGYFGAAGGRSLRSTAPEPPARPARTVRGSAGRPGR
ncbi:apolipoprotein N-acyltransferase [Streptomyces sp. NPDC006879]|uniref:apolipoprotein N-acyltransferase n=1 Tax=Streptomyces sp. NPDC006879 TaxID=3364767 RepID=UPI0036B7A2C1